MESCPKRTSIFKHVVVDNGLVSLIDTEQNGVVSNRVYHFVSKPVFKHISHVSSSSSRSSTCSSCVTPFVVYGGFLEKKPKKSPPHFLDFCFRCKKHIGVNTDIFMYRGDSPFCSEECRQQQIDMDEQAEEVEEKNRKLSASNSVKKAIKSNKKEEIKSSSSSTKTNQNCSFHSTLQPQPKKHIIF